MASPKDGKNYKTDVADIEQLFRLIQSIPTKKAEPFKEWMAQVAAQRIDQMQDPELNFEQAYADYRRLGYSDKWINQRLRSIEVRKELTDEWDRAGITDQQQYASLRTASRRSTSHQHKEGMVPATAAPCAVVTSTLSPSVPILINGLLMGWRTACGAEYSAV